MSAERVVYSIQRTYIPKLIITQGKGILTCDERIDIPTIEPLTNVHPTLYVERPLTVIPCIELAGEILSELNLTFETNEGVTVLPIKIAPGRNDPLENPYSHVRYVLVLPKGTTGIKTCKITAPEFGVEVQHNFTFGIMPPPYNYDNALFAVTASQVHVNQLDISDLQTSVDMLSQGLDDLTARVAALENKAGG